MKTNTDPQTEAVRVLVVDDHGPFRQFVVALLRQRPELQVVCEAKDGLDAVQQAEALHPDLVLLDIGLPTLNGMAVARRIRQTVPSAKIVFLTQESAVEVVREAFLLGAVGYVVKLHANTELLVGMDAVLRGESFVSSGVDEHASFTRTIPLQRD